MHIDSDGQESGCYLTLRQPSGPEERNIQPYCVRICCARTAR
jgi:hypothetical protein